MDDYPEFDIVDFIIEKRIFAANGSIPVLEIEDEDIVVLGQQLCIVTNVSEPFSTTLPTDSDQSSKLKWVVTITGRSIFWPSIEYEHSFLHHKDNKIGNFSREPVYYHGPLTNIQGSIMTIGGEVGEKREIEISDDKIGKRIRFLFGKKDQLEVRIATFMGCSWPDGFVNHGPIKRVDGRKPGTSIDNGSGSGDDSKAGPSSSESK
ncbi:hypothetical protein IMSHALPRED_002851 [Imshaugia aleurites]|uniref:Uncharacterized protein n=1 Tax=Imshaugia aleurites TaxID=172621 RepID=A0A8H3J6S1_9LECA|nr:hypothetical protein IMSHALPRED_002851 [Imshaugia aleurites]